MIMIIKILFKLSHEIIMNRALNIAINKFAFEKNIPPYINAN